jgi:hypothetical protein
MKKLLVIAMSLVLIAMAIWVVGCSKEDSNTLVPTASTKGGGNDINSANGTTLSGTTTIECVNYCTWTAVVSQPTDILDFAEGACSTVTADVTTTKICVTQFCGTITVTNGGTVATENLKIDVTLEGNQSGGFVAVAPTISVDVSGTPIIAAGGSATYSFCVNYPTMGDHSSYKFNPQITITNHSGHVGVPFGPSPDSPSIPGCPKLCDEATLTISCPTLTPVTPGVVVNAGDFNCQNVPDPITLSDEGTTHISFDICNSALTCGESFTAELKATVSCNGDDVSGSASFDITTAECSTPPGGCTYTIGYWKTHAVDNLYGHNTDHVSSHLPIYLGTLGGAQTVVVAQNTDVVSIMKRIGPGGSSNGILKLYAQLLGAKLSMAQDVPSDPSCIQDVVDAADAFLATHNAEDWATLSKSDRSDVLGWMSMLDQYNNGLLPCATHCQ